MLVIFGTTAILYSVPFAPIRSPSASVPASVEASVSPAIAGTASSDAAMAADARTLTTLLNFIFKSSFVCLVNVLNVSFVVHTIHLLK